MAKRNLFKTAEAVKYCINPHYDMRSTDLEKLYNMAAAGYPCEAFATAFRFGYAMGMKVANKKPCQCANTNRASLKTNHGNRA